MVIDVLRLRILLVLVALAVAVAVSAGGVQATVSGERQPRDLGSSSCNLVKVGASRHVLYRHGVSCGPAKRWVKRLAATRGRAKPRGWACSSGSAYRSSGYCERRGKHFGWNRAD